MLIFLPIMLFRNSSKDCLLCSTFTPLCLIMLVKKQCHGNTEATKYTCILILRVISDSMFVVEPEKLLLWQRG